MDSQAKDQNGSGSCNFESELEWARANHERHTTQLTNLEAELAVLEGQRVMPEMVHAAVGLLNVDGEIARVRNEIQRCTGAIKDAQKLIDSLIRESRETAKIHEFKRFAKELVVIGNQLGIHAGAIASLAERGQEASLRMDKFIKESFPKESDLRREWAARESLIFQIGGDSQEESPLNALRALAVVGELVKSRMDTLEILAASELGLRR